MYLGNYGASTAAIAVGSILCGVAVLVNIVTIVIVVSFCVRRVRKEKAPAA